MKRTLFLFDIDGTILKTGGAGMRAMYRAAARLFGEQATWHGIEAAGHLDPLIFAEFTALNQLENTPDSHANFQRQYLQELALELKKSHASVIAMPGIHDILELLAQRAKQKGDLVLGLLTGNYTAAVPLKLAAVGVDSRWFEITAFGDEGKTRPDLVALAMRKYTAWSQEQADPRRVIVIGDTPRDVACAHAHGCVAVGVATGSFSVEQLRHAGADLAVQDLRDPTPLLALLEL